MKNLAEQQAGYGEQKDGVPFKKTRHGKNSPYPRSGRYWREPCLTPQGSCQGSIYQTINRGAGPRHPDVWPGVWSGEPLALKGNGAS